MSVNIGVPIKGREQPRTHLYFVQFNMMSGHRAQAQGTPSRSLLTAFISDSILSSKRSNDILAPRSLRKILLLYTGTLLLLHRVRRGKGRKGECPINGMYNMIKDRLTLPWTYSGIRINAGAFMLRVSLRCGTGTPRGSTVQASVTRVAMTLVRPPQKQK
jgi:hypothetical protein